MSQQERELPLFPLQTVLFPEMTIPLHIFEERYKQLLRDIGDRDGLFGVVLIKEGKEVGPPATPHEVGTVARILRIGPAPGGRLFVSAQGVQRFRILDLHPPRPYLTAWVRLLEPPAGDSDPGLLEEAGATLLALVRGQMALHGGWVRAIETPADPATLSDRLGAALRADLRDKQRLLEMDSTKGRLELALKLAQADLERLRRELQQERLPQRLALN